MNKSGFTIIELLFSLMIASFLIMTLTMILGQTNKARTFAQTEVHTALLKNSLITTLYQDFAGAILLQKKEETEGKSASAKTSSDKEEISPIVINRSSENMVEEIRFTTVSAVRYQTSPVTAEIIYSLVPSDQTKKIYKIQRKMIVKNQDQSKQKESEPIVFLENIIKCTAQLVKLSAKDKSSNEGKNSFELIDEWPLESANAKVLADKEKKEEKAAGKNQPPKASEQKKEIKEQKIEIPYIKITIVYLKASASAKATADKTSHTRSVEEDFTLFIPLFIYKHETQKADQNVPNKQEPSKESTTDKQSSDAKVMATESKKIAKNSTVAHNRASKTLGSIFGTMK